MRLCMVWYVLFFGVAHAADFATVRPHPVGDARLLRQYRTERNTELLTCSIRCYGDVKCMAVNYNMGTKACEYNDKNGYYDDYRSEGKVGWSIYNVVERLCPESWMLHQISCYHFSNTQANWTTAVEQCHARGGYLAEVNNQMENAFLRGKTQSVGENFWIGGSDLQKEKEWIWENSQTRVTFHGWSYRNPDNAHNKEHCMGMGSAVQWKWNDMQCKYTFKYVCEMPVAY